jgi:hypothetical protein
LLVLLLSVAVGADAQPASHVLRPDDLVGEWRTNETTSEQMNDYDLEAGIPKRLITTKGGSDEFVIVRRGRFLFKTTIDGKPSDAIALSLKSGSNGQLISDSGDGIRIEFAAVGAKLRVEDRLKGAEGGSVTGLYTRVAGFSGSGVAAPLQPIHARSGYKELRALVGLDRVLVDCEFHNPNGMPVMVHVVGKLITQNRGTRQDEDDVAIPGGATRNRVFVFNNIDLGRAGPVNSNCDVTSPDGIPIESF